MTSRLRFDQFAEMIAERIEDPSSSGLERYVGLEHLDPEAIDIKRWGAPADVTSTKFRFYPGDVIYGRRRAYQRKAGLADFDGLASAHALVLRAVVGVCDPAYLAYMLVSESFTRVAVEISVGSLSPTINWRDLRVQEFDLPSLDEQRRAVEVMRAVDREIEAASSVLSLSILAQSSLVTERVAMAPTIALEEVALLDIGRTPPRDNAAYWTTDLERPFCTIADLTPGETRPTREGVTGLAETTGKAKRFAAGTLLMSFKLTIGRISLAAVDLFPNEAIVAINPRPGVRKDYLELALASTAWEKLANSAVKGKTLNKKSLARLPVPNLETAGQDDLLTAVAPLRAISTQAAATCASLRSLRTSLLQELIG
jgi:type I restriction enzyme S subunit